MDIDLFHKIIDEAATIKYFSTFILNGLSEPLLDPRMPDLVAYITEKIPGAVKNIFTNGVYLTPKMFDRLKAAGLDSLIISLNANTQEQHEKIMGIKGKFDETVANAEYARANKDGLINFQVDAVGNDDTFPAAECYKFIDRWGNRMARRAERIEEKDGVGLIVREGNWANKTRTIRFPENPGRSCPRALLSVYVQYNGIVTACCFDPLGDVTFGNLNSQTLREIYNSEKYYKFREDHFGDNADRWDICRNCTRI
jgi:radical SAM protein with 4Fe4S-binding SPASM domain